MALPTNVVMNAEPLSKRQSIVPIINPENRNNLCLQCPEGEAEEATSASGYSNLKIATDVDVFHLDVYDVTSGVASV